MVTTQFFAIKIARYMHEHGICDRTLARVAAKAYRNGACNPNAWRREADQRQRTSSRPRHGQRPADAVHVLLAGRGRRRARASPAASAARRRGLRPVTAAGRSPRAPGASAPSRSSARRSRAAATVQREHRRGGGGVRGRRGRARPSRRRAAAGHRERRGGHPPGRVRLLQARRAGAAVAAGATEIDGALPVNTDGGCIANGEPIGASGLRQVHEVVTAAARRRPAPAGPRAPRLGFTHVYGAPGISACAVLAVVSAAE